MKGLSKERLDEIEDGAPLAAERSLFITKEEMQELVTGYRCMLELSDLLKQLRDRT